MTVRINFLPHTYQPPKQIDSKGWLMTGAAAAAILATGVYYTNVYAGTLALEKATQAAQGQLQTVKGDLARAGQITQRETGVAQAEADLKALTGRHWSGVLLNLRDSTPQHVTWTSLAASEEKIVLKGTSRGMLDVAQLLGSLVNDPEVDQVWLHYANEKGEKITVTVDSKDPAAQQTTVQPADAAAKQQGESGPRVIELGTFRQFEYELEITFTKVEGGEKQHGA